ncbi:MAG: hypothetical protein FWC22_02525 [Treponema sp.]|nr:hypothetical protein [Treponema sp.]
MRKNSFLFICAAALVFFACDLLPDSIEISGNPEISLPLDAGSAILLNDDILNQIKKTAAEFSSDIKVMRYNGNQSSVQTFLFQYMSDFSVNLDEYLADFDLDQLTDITLDIDPADINFEINLNGFSNLNKTLDEIKISADISGISENMETIINYGFGNSSGYSAIPLIVAADKLDLPDELLQDVPNFKDSGFKMQEINMEGFNSVTFHEGCISIILEIHPGNAGHNIIPDADLTGVDITFSNITISDGVNAPVTGYAGGESSIRLTGNQTEREVVFNLGGKTLNKEFSVNVGKYKDDSAGDPRFISISSETKNITPVKIRGISGFDIDLEFDINDSVFDLGVSNSGFLHAKIGTGNIKFDLPSKNSGNTWIDGITMPSNITISQNAYSDAGSKYVQHNSGSPWQGLNIANIQFGSQVNLNTKHFNPNSIKINTPDNKINISSNNVSFMLGDEDAAGGTLTIKITPSINLTNFSEIHVDTGDSAIMPELSPFSFGEAAEYIKQIHFNEIGVKIKFDAFDINGLGMRITGKNPGKPEILIDTGVKSVYQQGGVKKIDLTQKDVFVDITPNNAGEFEMQFALELYIDGKPFSDVITIKNFTPKSKLEFKAANDGITAVFDWSQAVIDLSSVIDLPLNGSFPEEGEDGINLQEMMGEYIEGFNFNDIKTYLYIGIPGQFSGLKPDIAIKAFNNGSPISMFASGNLGANGNLVIPDNYNFSDLDPANTGKYSGSLQALSQNSIPLLVNNVLNTMPSDLRFKYDVKFDEIAVTPDMLGENGEASVFNLAAVMVVPMSLTAGENGAKIKIPGLFSSQTDFLDRSGPGESFLPDSGDNVKLKINSLTLKITADNAFTGGELYLKREGENEEDGKERLRFSLSNNTLNITVSEKLLEYLNSNEGYPYCIEEAGIRFNKGNKVQIPANINIKIEFSADFRVNIPLGSGL